ncbi:ABC transporter ATP-binding protein [Paenibacillus sp. SI8]|uniref:ABC transporter ATP-binding protein n=1 Tax=unclassified Paenibacillus TaxID=185978 RepID=UPI0034652E40
MSYLRIENVSKKFGASNVLQELNLRVEQGELVTLLGSSGCGKSTLLRCISGLTTLEEGEIYLEEKPITDRLPKDRGVGMVFQSYGLFPNLHVGDNVAFGLRMQRLSKASIASRVQEMLSLVGLEDKAKSYPHELSGGQQQRVALARSLAVQPKLMLMDEPLSALDAKIRKSLRMELRRIQKSLGMTTIFVTHDQEEALIISDRVCVMHQGQIVQMGTPEEIYTHPRNEYVARFIGSYNVLNVQEMARLTGSQVWRDGCYAIRPEAILLAHRNSEQSWPESDGFEAAGRIDEIIVLGNVLRFSVHVEDTTLTVDMLNSGERPGLQAGNEVKLWIPRESCKYLDGGK